MTTMKENAAAVGEAVLSAKVAVLDMGRSASDMMDQARADTARCLHSTASAVRSAGNQSAASVEEFTESAGDRLDATSKYIRKHNGADMLCDLRTIVRRHPGSFLLLTASLAACVGYFAASKTNDQRG